MVGEAAREMRGRNIGIAAVPAIVPAIAYNLVVPLLFALTGVGAFSVAYNLFGGHHRGRLLAGVMALTFTVVLGNLGVVHLIRGALIDLGGELFSSTIPGFPETVAMFLAAEFEAGAGHGERHRGAAIGTHCL